MYMEAGFMCPGGCVGAFKVTPKNKNFHKSEKEKN